MTEVCIWWMSGKVRKCSVDWEDVEFEYFERSDGTAGLGLFLAGAGVDSRDGFREVLSAGSFDELARIIDEDVVRITFDDKLWIFPGATPADDEVLSGTVIA